MTPARRIVIVMHRIGDGIARASGCGDIRPILWGDPFSLGGRRAPVGLDVRRAEVPSLGRRRFSVKVHKLLPREGPMATVVALLDRVRVRRRSAGTATVHHARASRTEHALCDLPRIRA